MADAHPHAPGADVVPLSAYEDRREEVRSRGSFRASQDPNAPATVDPVQMWESWVELEQSVLGNLLINPDLLEDLKAKGGVSLFLDPAHRWLAQLLLTRRKAGLPTVLHSLAHLPEVGETLAELGGVRYLARVAGAAMPTSYPYHVADLAEMAAKRDLSATIAQAQALLASPTSTAADVSAKLELAVLSVPASAASSLKPVRLGEAAYRAAEEVAAAVRGDDTGMVATGIAALDKIIGGGNPGDMILLGGRPGMCKTAVALSIGLNVARRGHPVIFGSFEMTPVSLALRALADQGAGPGRDGVFEYSRARLGELSDAQIDNLKAALAELYDLPFWFLGREAAEASMLYSGAKAALARFKGAPLTPLVIVDYLQLMRAPGASQYQIVTEVSKGTKGVAMRLECPVLALSQLSRNVESRENKRPTMQDLRDSGQLEQDADAIIFAYRDEYYLQRDQPDPEDIDAFVAWEASMARAKNRLELIVAKQRQGNLGTARVRMNPALNFLWEDAKPWEGQSA